MKYLDIDITPLPGTQTLNYPQGYQEEIGNFAQDHLYYDDDLGFPHLLLCIEEGDFKSGMLKTKVKELTETEALAVSEAKETRTEVITDEAKVRRLEIQSRLGMELSVDDQKALDPYDPISGFGITEILADRIAKLKTKERAKLLAKNKKDNPIA